jgi:transcriptional regulator with XRE-family HTH domain
VITIVITVEPWTYDPSALARLLVRERAARGWSTRDLAERAGISQAYVSVLERGNRPAAEAPRVPTVAVLAQLAAALQLSPPRLLLSVLAVRQRHALLVCNDPRTDPIEAAKTAITMQGDTLPDVWLASFASPSVDRAIDLRSRLPHRARSGYDPAAVTAALEAELGSSPLVNAGAIGLVVTQQSAALRRPSCAPVVTRFEKQWAEVVRTRSEAVGATVLWNICAYRSDDLARAPDRRRVASALVASHDEVWFAHDTAVAIGNEGRALVLAGSAPRSPRTSRTPATGTVRTLTDPQTTRRSDDQGE